MRVSVALCTFHGEAYLHEQLESLLQQEHQPFELVVCDDRSTDSTWQILEQFAERSPFPVLLYRNEKRLGSTRNFDKAMQLCSGDAIALCDQDDIWYPQKLRVLSAALEEDAGVAGVFSNGDLLREDQSLEGSLWHRFGFLEGELKTFQHSDPLGVMIRSNRVTGMTLMLRREALAYVSPIPANWVHDSWIGFMLLLHGRLLACPQVLVAYRLHGAQQLSVPKGFLAEIRSRGVRPVLEELSDRARKESSLAVLQLEVLLERLHHGAGNPAIAAAVERLDAFLHYQRLRSQIQQWNPLRRAAALVKNRRSYRQFAPRLTRDCLVDLLSVQHPVAGN